MAEVALPVAVTSGQTLSDCQNVLSDRVQDTKRCLERARKKNLRRRNFYRFATLRVAVYLAFKKAQEIALYSYPTQDSSLQQPEQSMTSNAQSNKKHRADRARVSELAHENLNKNTSETN